jgi:hypothetical protein
VKFSISRPIEGRPLLFEPRLGRYATPGAEAVGSAARGSAGSGPGRAEGVDRPLERARPEVPAPVGIEARRDKENNGRAE